MKNLIPWRKKEEHGLMSRETASTFEVLHRQMNDLFEDFFRDFGGPSSLAPWTGKGLAAVAPSFEVSETDEAVHVTAELPGMDEKDILVTLDDNILTVRGEKKQEREEKKKNFFLSERSYGQFQRVIPLPAGVEADKAKAQFKKGVLTISLPKSRLAATEGRHIPVSTE